MKSNVYRYTAFDIMKYRRVYAFLLDQSAYAVNLYHNGQDYAFASVDSCTLWQGMTDQNEKFDHTGLVHQSVVVVDTGIDAY